MDVAVQDHHRVRMGQADLLEQLDATEGLEVKLRDEEICIGLREQADGLLGGRSREDTHGFRLEVTCGPLEEVRIIVGDNDRLLLDIWHKGLKVRALRAVPSPPWRSGA